MWKNHERYLPHSSPLSSSTKSAIAKTDPSAIPHSSSLSSVNLIKARPETFFSRIISKSSSSSCISSDKNSISFSVLSFLTLLINLFSFAVIKVEVVKTEEIYEQKREQVYFVYFVFNIRYDWSLHVRW